MNRPGKALDAIRTEVSRRVIQESETGRDCSQAALIALGVEDAKPGIPRTPRQVKRELERNGYEVTVLWKSYGTDNPTLAQFLRSHDRGSYYIATINRSGKYQHSMAVVDGMLTDTDTWSGSRRRVNVCYEVRKDGRCLTKHDVPN